MASIIAKLTEDGCRAKVGSTWVIDGVATKVQGGELPGDTDLLVRAYRCDIQSSIHAPGRAVEIYCDVLAMSPGAEIDVSGAGAGACGGKVLIVARCLEGTLVIHADGQKGAKGDVGSTGSTGPTGPAGADGNVGSWSSYGHPEKQGQPGGGGGPGSAGGKGGTGRAGGDGGSVEVIFIEPPPAASIRVTAHGGDGGDGGSGGSGGDGGPGGDGGRQIDCSQVFY